MMLPFSQHLLSLLRILLLLLLSFQHPLVVVASESASSQSASSSAKASSQSSSHTSNYAVIVSSSRYWFNYRHVVNALTIYNMLKSSTGGNFDDDHIILMIADEYAISPRNPFVNQILHQGPNGPSLLLQSDHKQQQQQQQQQSQNSKNDVMIEIDYRGEDVTVENLRRVLTGRSSSSSSAYSTSTTSTALPVLQSDAQSNVLIYLTGHGGDSFFKFQDVEEIMATEIAALIAQMHQQQMYQNILFIADTCQAFTLSDAITTNDDDTTNCHTPNVTVVASSLRGESSYAHHSDPDLGLAVIERYTHAMSQHVLQQKKNPQDDWSQLTLEQGLVTPYAFAQQQAHIGYKTTTTRSNISNESCPLFMSDFFVNVQAAAKTTSSSSSSSSSSKNHHKASDGDDQAPFITTTTSTTHPRLLYPLQQEGRPHVKATTPRRRETETDRPDVPRTTPTAAAPYSKNLLFFAPLLLCSSSSSSSSSLEQLPTISLLLELQKEEENQGPGPSMSMSSSSSNPEDGNADDDNNNNNSKDWNNNKPPTSPPSIVLGLTTLLLSGLVFLGSIVEERLLFFE